MFMTVSGRLYVFIRHVLKSFEVSPYIEMIMQCLYSWNWSSNSLIEWFLTEQNLNIIKTWTLFF